MVKIIYFFLGLGATSSLLAFVVSGRIISVLNICFVICFIDLLVSPKRSSMAINMKGGYTKMFIGWMILGVLSSCYGIFRFTGYDEFATASISSLFKIFIYFLFLLLIGLNAAYTLRINSLMSGIKFGILLNMVWCVADAGMYYTTNVSLTNTVFQSYIQAADMRLGMASLTDGFMIRSVGLNNDPATVGFFSIVAASYSFLIKKYWILILAILASFACVSFTAIVGIILVTLYYVLFAQKEIRKKLSIFFSVATLSFVGFVYFTYSNSDIAVSVRTALEIRASAKVDGSQSTEVREYYIRNFLPAVGEQPDALVIGTGFNTASFPYFSLGLEQHEEFRPYDMENTYIATFFDIGSFGLFFFVMFYVRIFFMSRSKLKIFPSCDLYKTINATSISALISFMFYHYTLYSVLMFISIAALLNVSKQSLK